MDDFEVHSPDEKVAITVSEGARDAAEARHKRRRRRLGSQAEMEAMIDEEERASSVVTPEDVVVAAAAAVAARSRESLAQKTASEASESSAARVEGQPKSEDTGL
jgi:hypothetical protein